MYLNIRRHKLSIPGEARAHTACLPHRPLHQTPRGLSWLINNVEINRIESFGAEFLWHFCVAGGEEIKLPEMFLSRVTLTMFSPGSRDLISCNLAVWIIHKHFQGTKNSVRTSKVTTKDFSQKRFFCGIVTQIFETYFFRATRLSIIRLTGLPVHDLS